MLTKINKISIILLLLLQVDFFSIFRVTDLFSHYNSYLIKYISLFLVVIILVVNIIFAKINKYIEYKSFFNVPITIFLMSILIVAFISSYQYNQSLYETARYMYFFFIILLYYFLTHYFSSSSNINFLISAIKIFGFIYSVILIVQVLLYMRTGSFFLNVGPKGLNITNNILDNDTAIFISGIPRIQRPADFIVFSFLVTNISLVNKNGKLNIKDLVYYIVDLAYILFIAQTRMYMILSIILVIMLILFTLDLGKRLLFGIFIFGIIIIFQRNIFQLFGFFSGSRVASTLIRNSELKYYLPKIFSNSGFGMGFASDSRYYFLNHGMFANSNIPSFYLDDVGIFGSVAQLGILGIISSILFMIYLIISVKKVHNKKAISFICIYIFITSISLSLLNVQRILYFPIVLYFVTNLLKSKSIMEPRKINC